MTRSGPARINSNGEYHLLCDQKTKSTLNVTQGVFGSGYGGALSLGSYFMYPFSFRGFNIPSTEAFHKVYTAVSEQYNIVYFLYPAGQRTYEGQGVETFRLSYTVLMSYDIVTGNIGYSVPWPVEQTTATAATLPQIPWQGTVLYGSSPYYTSGTRNCFAMTTLLYKPDKGKAKDVIIMGTRESKWLGNYNENNFNFQYNYLDPTIFYGKNWSMYTRTNLTTKIIRPSKTTTRIAKIRPIMRIGHGHNYIKFKCYVISFSDLSMSGQEIYNHEEICEIFPGSVFSPDDHDDYLATYNFDNKVAISESGLVTKDGSIIFEDSKFADEHIIIFSFHTAKDDIEITIPATYGRSAKPEQHLIINGSIKKANFCTTTGIVGLEIFYDEQGALSR